MPDPRNPIARYETHTQEPASGGVPCPICETLISISIHDLLYRRSFRCPKRGCGTLLRLDSRESSQALAALRTFKNRLREVRPGSR